jgi:hypothetical protein
MALAVAGRFLRRAGPAITDHVVASLFDVTRGSNGTCSPVYLCTAGPGYDGPTGLGTPNGTRTLH